MMSSKNNGMKHIIIINTGTREVLTLQHFLESVNKACVGIDITDSVLDETKSIFSEITELKDSKNYLLKEIETLTKHIKNINERLRIQEEKMVSLDIKSNPEPKVKRGRGRPKKQI